MTDFTVIPKATGRTLAFEIRDPAGRLVWSAGGFSTEAYRAQSMEIALRNLRGRAPRSIDYSSENLKPETVSIVKSLVAKWYPHSKRA